MKILVVAESIDVNDSSGSKVNVALIYNLKNAGFNLKVLHFTRKNIDLNGIQCIPIKENRFSILFLLSRFVRLFQRYTSLLINPKLENIFGFSFTHSNDSNSIAKSIKNEINNISEYDLIITLSKGGSFRPHRALLKIPEIHSKWMAYMHDPYPFHFYPRPYNWVERGFRQKENFIRCISEKAKISVFPSKLLKEWMGSYFPNFIKTGIVIPHQILHENFEEKLPDFFIQNQFALLHAGNLLSQRNPKYLIEAYINFLNKFPEAISNSRLYLIGNNTTTNNELIKYKNNKNVYLEEYLDYDVIQTLEKNVSVNIILEAISEISPFLPGKFPNCIKANKPIISLSPYYSEVRRLLGNDYPYWSEADEVEKIEQIITDLYRKWIIRNFVISTITYINNSK